MRTIKLNLLALFVLACASQAQGQEAAAAYSSVPRADIAVGYSFIHANAPPGGCRCFGLNGAFASGSYRFLPWLGAAVEVEGGHADNISALNQNLTLITYAGGPRISLPGRRISPFGEVLVGYAQGRDSYFPSGNTFTNQAGSLALKGGGGVDVYLYRNLGVRVKAQYLHTGFPNGSNNEQNHFILGAGLVYHFGRKALPLPPSAPPPPPTPVAPAPVQVIAEPLTEVAFSCSTDHATVVAGQTVEVITNTMTAPDGLDVQYSWTTTGGTVQGSGKDVSVDTTGLMPGRYRITGHASATGHPNANSSCDMGFRVKEAEPVASSTDVKTEAARENKMFHDAVKDAFFDYDKSTIRPDTQAAILVAAQYLQQHPDISVLVGGYSDERGSSEYNLSLGLKRAQVTKQALVSAGVDPDRIQIVSYGKGSQVCTQENEACWQQNRRAAFEMHP